MKKYVVYIDDGEKCYKMAIPATSKASAKKYVQGNGDIISIEETQCYISLEKVAQALIKANFGEMEVDFITRTLSQTDIAN